MYGGDFWSKVIIMVSIIFILIKRFYNCNVSEIMVSMGIDECIFVIYIILCDFIWIDFVFVGIIE